MRLTDWTNVKNTFLPKKKNKSENTNVNFKPSTDKEGKQQHKLCKLDLATFFKIFSKIQHSMDLEDDGNPFYYFGRGGQKNE